MKSSVYVFFAVLLFSETLWAHPGHGEGGFVLGLLHPITGFDHLLASLAVGLWAVRLGSKATRALPIAFVTSALLGASFGIMGYALGMSEIGIVASLFFLGFALFARVYLSWWKALVLIACFGAFHGFAHGKEMPESLSSLEFFAGFATSTLALHMLGIVFASLITTKLAPKNAQLTFRLLGITLLGGGIYAGALL